MAFFKVLLVFVCILAITLLIIKGKEDRKEQERIILKQSKRQQQLREARYQKEIAEEEEREKRLGKLTKSINYSQRSGAINTIRVYEKSQTVIILDREYKFRDVISCSVETQVTKGGEMYVTTPDRYQMAREQFLWGMGQKYNVTSYTQVVKEPDSMEYRVYISVNDFGHPLIVLCPNTQYEANEINSLMNVIIHQNQPQN